MFQPLMGENAGILYGWTYSRNETIGGGVEILEPVEMETG